MERLAIFVHGYICILASYMPPQCRRSLNISLAFSRGLFALIFQKGHENFYILLSNFKLSTHCRVAFLKGRLILKEECA